MKKSSVVRQILHRWPYFILLLTLSTAFISGDRGYFYRDYDWVSSGNIAIAANLSPRHDFLMFHHKTRDEDGNQFYRPYNRFPIGGYALLKLSMLPFGDDLSAQIRAARILTVLLFIASAVLAYLALCRLVGNRGIALAATLLAFSSYNLLYYNTLIGETIVGLLGMMLVFHGMVVFVRENRLQQLLIKVCIGLLLNWHAFALLLPFTLLALMKELFAGLRTRGEPYLKRLTVSLLRSRYLVLGVFALFFGTAVLTFNLTNEYIALDGKTPLTALPTFSSLKARTGQDPKFNAALADDLAWNRHLEQQSERMYRAIIPATVLLNSIDIDINEAIPPRIPSHSSPSTNGVNIGIVEIVFIFCVIAPWFLRSFQRYKILLCSLALSGLLWALLMRGTVAFHPHESVYYIGIPLVFFSLVLSQTHRLSKRWAALVVGTAVGLSAVGFAFSSLQTGDIGHDPETAEYQTSLINEFGAIHKITQGKNIFFPIENSQNETIPFSGARHGLDYYFSGGYLFFKDANRQLRDDLDGYCVTRKPVDGFPSLTPDNQKVFLYEDAAACGKLEAAQRKEAWKMYRQAILGRQPVARSFFDVYRYRDRLVYIRESCNPDNLKERFFLHIFPKNRDDLPKARRPHGFDNLDFDFFDYLNFDFRKRGIRFDGKCMAVAPLPKYDIDYIRTGQFNDQGELWSATWRPQSTDQ